MRIASLWNEKARLIQRGRKKAWFALTKVDKEEPVIWFHCASLGEFEMARPVMERFIETHPEWQLVVSFFSPSGYEFRKNYAKATSVFYLPKDSKKNARKLMKRMQPDLAVFVKYDLWYFYLKELVENDAPYTIISATFRENHRYFKNPFFKQMLTSAHGLFVQDEESKRLLEDHQIAGDLAGDTRCDRVLEIAEGAVVSEDIRHFCGDNLVIVAGSSWPEEEKMLQQAFARIPDGVKLIVAPHDVSENHLATVESRWPKNTIRYSQIAQIMNERILLIDNIGMLAALYKAAHLAFVGGGYSGYLHNILEPAAHGAAICFGPKTERFHEAGTLVEIGGAAKISDASALEQLIKDRTRLMAMGTIAKNYVQSRQGATHMIIHHLNNLT